MARRWRAGVAVALTLGVLLGMPVLAGAADVDAGLMDAGTDEDAAFAVAEEVEDLREEVRALDAFAARARASTPSVDLFQIDLRDDAAVKRRVTQIEKELRIARAEAKAKGARPPTHAEDAAAVVDAGGDPHAALLEGPADLRTLAELRVVALETRRRILGATHDERIALLAAEEAAQKAEQREREVARVEAEAARAEEARRRALASAEVAPTKADRDVAEARAAIEAARAAQVRYRAELVTRHRETTTSADALQTMGRRLADEGEAAHDASADALYDRVVAALVTLRDRSRASLGALDAPPGAPRPPAEVPGGEGAAALEADRVALVDAARKMDEEVRELTWSDLRATMADERQLNDLRIGLLDRISPDKRERVLGFGAEGRQQLAREIGRLQLEARWLRASGGELARAEWTKLRQPSEAGRLSFAVLTTLFVFWATLFVRQRLDDAVRAVNVFAARSARRSIVRVVQRATGIVQAIGREGATLLGVLALPLVVAIDWRHGAWSIPYTLVLWYAIYRLAVNATYRLLAWAASRNETAVTAAEAAKILASVRLATRYAFILAVVLAGAGAVLGRGYLYMLVVRLGWFGALPLGYVLVSWWRADISDTYLRMRPTGGLSDLVRRTRTRWAGFFVTILAFVVLLLGALVRTGRGFVLGFEHSRKALAYLFRRRLERQGEQIGIEEPRIDGALLAFFQEDAVEDASLLLGERFPELDALVARAASWRAGEMGTPTLVIGRTGYGKSSWLAEARRRLVGEGEARPVEVKVATRATSSVAVVEALASALAVDVTTLDALVDALAGGPRRVVTIDDAHLWFLRGVGQLEAWLALTELLERTSARILWIVAVAHYPWEFLRWTTRNDGAFRSLVHLRPWSEPDISALIEHRTAASGLEVSYEDLLEDEIDSIEGVDERARILSTARDYNRLIWDYAEGSPRVAMHVWSRSLVPAGPGRVRVRLFGRPAAAWLEGLGEDAKFVVAAIVWHEQLDAASASAVVRLPRLVCEDVLARLLEIGAAERWGDGRVRITALWWPPVVRYLRRKHLIET